MEQNIDKNNKKNYFLDVVLAFVLDNPEISDEISTNKCNKKNIIQNNY